MSSSIVIIPTYNEIENIEKMIRKVMSYDKGFHILIIEDGSPDGTAAKATVPSFKITSASRVGNPRESRISRALMRAILVILKIVIYIKAESNFTMKFWK